ncbi:hypothetical protein BKA70DRAFT_1473908 [Coprinopsis sp. MPI-PUGE-AT-0042]|nr:hypothetical protein BKA70DRAFT_1473908 [Coprinopsis sp. MPI-PUGE-AT-0042]
MGAAFSTWARWDDTVVQQVLATEAPPIQTSGPTFHQNAQGTQNFAAPIYGGTFIQNNQQDKEHFRNVLDFLSLVNFRSIQQENLGKWTPGTIKWLLQSSMFQSWLATQYAILWGTGMPGAGKTVLASVVIKHLQALAQASPDVCVAFVYCRYTEPMKVRDILAALVRQLLERFPHLLSVVEPLYAQHELEMTPPTQVDLIDAIRKICSHFRMAYLFIDGLDEALYDEQFDLLDTLKTVPANFFLTSRPLVRLKAVLPDAEFFDIAARNEDIELLVSQNISRSPDLQQVLAADEQQEIVIKKICESSCGMFLHASLMVEAVRHCTSSQRIMEKLDMLPAKLDVLYAEAFERIEMQPEEHAALAERVLLWVVYAYRPLTVEELQYAVASDPSVVWAAPENLVPETLLVSVCCGLIVIEAKKDMTSRLFVSTPDRVVRLVHYTALNAVKHVFERREMSPHCLLAEICVERLMNCGMPRSPLSYRRKPSWVRTMPYALQSYAYESWYFHATESIQCPAQPNARFAASILRFLAMCVASRAFQLNERVGERPVLDDITEPIHIVTFYHLPALLPLVGSQVNKRTRAGRSALSLAAWRKDAAMAELLLKLDGIDVNLQDDDGNTALMVAARHDDVVMAELLLKLDGINVNLQDNDGKNGAHELLLKLDGIDVNLQDDDGNTALMVAARRNDVVMAGLLLNLDGIDVNLQDDEGNTALMIAAEEGLADVVKTLLLEPRIDTNKCNKKGETALHHALYAGSSHTEVAWRLFDAPGIDIDAADAYGRTPRSALKTMGLPDSITRGPDVRSALENRWSFPKWFDLEF